MTEQYIDLDKAINERLKHETIIVTMTKTKLEFKIDDREIDLWKRKLNELGEPYTMVDTRED